MLYLCAAIFGGTIVPTYGVVRLLEEGQVR
jgi:hypothetical protein